MYEFSNWSTGKESEIRKFNVDKVKVKQIFDSVTKEGRKHLLEEEGYDVLNAYGFPRPKSYLCTSEEECVKRAEEIGYPVVMKIASQDIIHKSDAGGVKVGVKNKQQVSSSFNEIIVNAKNYKKEANIKGVLVQQMVESARETILGAKHDKLFGPLIMFGLGGIYVEALKDVVFRLAPIDEQEAMKMVESIKTYKILKGIRGQPPSDIKALIECLLRLSQLVTDFPEITEFDMNPLLVLEEGKGACAVDVRIGLA